MNIAFIFPQLLPLPAVKGGATEVLIQKIIDENEMYNKLNIDVYCKFDANAKNESKKYKFTRFNYIIDRDSFIDKIKFFLFRFHRKFSKNYVAEPYLKNIVKQLKRNCYDAVIVESSFRFIPYIKRNIKAPIFLHLHFDAVKSNNPQWLKQSLKCCDCVICVSSFIEKSIKDFDKETDIRLLNNVTDVELFCRQKYVQEVKKLQKQYSIADNDVVLLYSGRIIEVKGVLELIKAFKIAKAQNNNLKLLLAGSAEYGETIYDEYHKAIIDEIGNMLNNDIIITGFIDYKIMPQYYSLADITILPTTLVDEAAPLTVLESLSSECCFIGSDSGAIPELADYKYKHIVCRNENYINSLADMIIFCSKDKNYIKEAGIYGRKHVINKHNSIDYYNNFYTLIKDEGIK